MGKGNTKVMNFQDKGTQIQIYTDEQTGLCLMVEYDNPEHPKLTVSSKGRFVLGEELDAATRRLLAQAGITPPEQPGQAAQGGKQ